MILAIVEQLNQFHAIEGKDVQQFMALMHRSPEVSLSRGLRLRAIHPQGQEELSMRQPAFRMGLGHLMSLQFVRQSW